MGASRCDEDQDLMCNEEEEDCLLDDQENLGAGLCRLGSMCSGGVGFQSPLRAGARLDSGGFGNASASVDGPEFDSPPRSARRVLAFRSSPSFMDSPQSPCPPSFPGPRSPCITPQDQLLRNLLTR